MGYLINGQTIQAQKIANQSAHSACLCVRTDGVCQLIEESESLCRERQRVWFVSHSRETLTKPVLFPFDAVI